MPPAPGSRVQSTDDIPYSIGEWYGIESMNGDGASVLDNVWHMDLFSKRGQEFFGVRYFLGKTPLNANQVEVFRGRSGVKIFENPSAYPRSWRRPGMKCEDRSHRKAGPPDL